MIKEAISRVVMGDNLSTEEAGAVMEEIMEGRATDAQIGSLLTGLRLKGETVEEILGCAQVIRDKSFPFHTRNIQLVDTCGTGGDGTGTFNISTTAAFVVAGAGFSVAKHGNRSVSSQSGSADVLKALGVNIELTPEETERVLDRVGISFLFAPVFHQAMKYAIGPRREIGIRSIFNILGPLTNPARANYQVLGVYDEGLTETIASVLDHLGVKGACVVHGAGGLDEVSTLGPSKITLLNEGEIKTFYISPEDFGIPKSSILDIKGNDPLYNADITRLVLNGEKGPAREVVLLNAAAALIAVGAAVNFFEGIKLAANVIDKGLAREKMNQLIAISNSSLTQGA